ncbi:LysM peptidoglycan-binding domain-containing protein [Prevotella sp. OH937_COT-195]|uniref:LysM peptidoglycan-binding domain-containing protein n=1 Tax=Prevotella sp. OH937_COT-195 TaxID=2491051 RepID=UPI000F64EC6A|nr:LysM domain-containing protein [Prevotella sp. OH937_COT-195]RRC99141.1 LysM peptidoglycan-binding domain-containing protein [Prevotella sp. OH937_COT-195]
MIHFFRCSLMLAFFMVFYSADAQVTKWKDMHKVVKGETIYGISRKYGITEEQLRTANPEMNTPGYKLKKGNFIFIPYATEAEAVAAADKVVTRGNEKADVRKRAIRMGVMLPLHNVDGDGRRMVEYYRGLLLACDQMKREGISVDVYAWNVDINADIRMTLLNKGAEKCDIIFGPLYTKQVKPLVDFASKYGIKVVIPFSIESDAVKNYPNVFQIYQNPSFLNQEITTQFVKRFESSHPIFIDCNDPASTKGNFTTLLRKELDTRKIAYNITNINSEWKNFARSFLSNKHNVVVLNSEKSPCLNRVIMRIDSLRAANPQLQITLFGYTEWLMYAKYNIDKYCMFDTYIPAHFYYNSVSQATNALERTYKQWFRTDMQDYLPRFAITGYDHGTFFLRGLHREGSKFAGVTADKTALQTRLHFRRVGKIGGYQNTSFLFIHYNKNHSVSTINF